MSVQNQVTLIGNLTKNCDGRFIENKNKEPLFAGNFSIAVNEFSGGKQYTNFIRCNFIGNHWENVANYLLKGTKIAVQGSLRSGSYERDGVTHYTTDVQVESIQLLSDSSKKDTPDAKSFDGAKETKTWKPQTK